MRYSISAAIILALSSISLGELIASSQSNPPSLQAIADAQYQWAADTSKVSKFLSAAESLSPDDLAFQAGQALANENDELTHKTVLDKQFVFVENPDASVQQANNVLVDQGTFQVVVDGLQNLAENGASMTRDQVFAAILSINVDRCFFVLPSIDTYFQAAANLLQNGVILLASRPDNCP